MSTCHLEALVSQCTCSCVRMKSFTAYMWARDAAPFSGRWQWYQTIVHWLRCYAFVSFQYDSCTFYHWFATPDSKWSDCTLCIWERYARYSDSVVSSTGQWTGNAVVQFNVSFTLGTCLAGMSVTCSCTVQKCVYMQQYWKTMFTWCLHTVIVST